MLGEGPERVEDGEKAAEAAGDELRKEVAEEYGPEGLGEYLPDWSEEEAEPAMAPERKVEVASDDHESHLKEEPAHEEGQTPIEPPKKDGPDLAPKEPSEDPTSPNPDEQLVTSEEVPQGAPGDRVGSFSQNDNQIVVTEQERPEGPGKATPAPEAETSGLHHFPAGAHAEQAEEARTFEVLDYGKGEVVRVPKTDLEREGFEPEPGKNAIVQLGLREAEGEEVETVFARYNSSDRRAEAYVEDIGGEKGSRYELVEASRYDEDRFVRDFERGKCEHLQNVKLEHAEEKMFVNVDGRRVELEEYKMSTSGSHVIMRGKLDGDDSCKIEFDGRRASVRFGRDYPVEAMRMEGDELVVKWAQSRNERHETRLHLEHLATPERPSLNQFDRKEMLGHLKTSDCPERINGLYQFTMDKESHTEIKRLLDDADKRGGKHYEMMKAEISERLVPNLLETYGWKRIERHPFSTKDKESASANGADWLMRAPDGKTVLMEVKWYEDRNQAIGKATRQVGDDFRDHEDDPDLKLEGAYIATVDYDPDSSYGSSIRIHVVKVRPLEELA